MHACNPNYSGVGSQFKDSRGKKLEKLHPNKQAGVVFHICIPSYKGGIGWRIIVQSQLGIKHDILSEK